MAAEFYVYLLYDTETKTPFYVGKGQGFRIDQHERDTDPNREKAEKFLALNAGRRLGKRVIGRYETEAEAFAVEATLIKWVYGLRNLTNRIHGRHHELIRSIGHFDELPGIDVERRITAADGTFTEKQLGAIRANFVLEKLGYLSEVATNTLAQMGMTDVLVSECDISFPQDPQIRLNTPGWPCNVRLKLQLSGNYVAPAFTAPSGRKADREALQLFADKIGQDVKRGTPHFIGLWQVEGNGNQGVNASRPALDDELAVESCIQRMVHMIKQNGPY